MRKKRTAMFIIIIILFNLLYWLPFLLIKNISDKHIVHTIDRLPDSDAVIIFGTLVDNRGTISPLLRERLEAGIQILEKGRARKIVVSNMKSASDVMAGYLYSRGIKPELVEIDPEADNTPDTCRFERKHHRGRRIILVSQGFHLPRVSYQCRKAGITGTAFPAESIDITDRSTGHIAEIIYIRCSRYIREAGLTWLAVLNIYR